MYKVCILSNMTINTLINENILRFFLSFIIRNTLKDHYSKKYLFLSFTSQKIKFNSLQGNEIILV